MGLAEKRIVAEFDTKFKNELLEKFKSEMPFEFEIEILWDGLLREIQTYGIQAEGLKIYFESVYIGPTILAFKNIIAADAQAVNVFKQKIKKICFCATDEWKFGSDAYYMDNQTLKIDHIFSNIDKFGEGERESDLTKFLKKQL